MVVFLVQHLHILPQGEEDVKIIGIYSTKERALQSIHKLRIQPGFKSFGKIIDPYGDESKSGFYIDEYVLDEDNWEEGYITV